MCQVATIVDQYKGMASLDYASMSNTLTRELLVIALESPEAFNQVRAIAEAAQCSAKAISASDEEEGEGEGDAEEEEEPDAFSIFVSDEEIADAQAKADAVNECTGDVDRWSTGKIFGRLFARFFDQELKPNI